ncbi:MAG TPA: glycine dehydrogenase subunit 2, partial [Bacillota bacterium]|nr:glycine dehydrogenase subunit 2 [Bacillota bacterium]
MATVRKFHQARWNEPVIFELSRPGERGIMVPEAEPGIRERVGDGTSRLPGKMIRQDMPALPEVA